VNRRQELVAVAEMVLAELPGRIAERLEQLGERRVLVRKAFLRAGQPDLEQAGAHRALPGDEGGAAGGAGLLAVVVREDRAFVGDAVDVGCAIEAAAMYRYSSFALKFGVNPYSTPAAAVPPIRLSVPEQFRMPGPGPMAVSVPQVNPLSPTKLVLAPRIAAPPVT
jgi:hypothetical protein